MSSSSILSGGAVLAVVFYGVTEWGLSVRDRILAPTPFMAVEKMTVSDDLKVTASRQVYRDAVAEWDVVVVGKAREAPACRTIPGEGKHEGWSPYEKDQKRELSFSLDDWVFDPGCADRLTPGQYKMSVIWKPRDGSPVIEAETTFTVNKE